MEITDKRQLIIGGILIGTTVLNMIMCLNLYRQMGNLMYKVYQLDSNVYSAIQSLSNDVWEMKNKNQVLSSVGQFE